MSCQTLVALGINIILLNVLLLVHQRCTTCLNQAPHYIILVHSGTKDNY